MKIKNQNTLPSKYVLLILVIVCGILLGAERFMDGGRSLKLGRQLYHCPHAEGD